MPCTLAAWRFRQSLNGLRVICWPGPKSCAAFGLRQAGEVKGPWPDPSWTPPRPRVTVSSLLLNLKATGARTESFLPGDPRSRQVFARLIAGHRLSSMVDRTYVVTLRPPSRAIQQVFAARAEVRGSHLVFVDAKGHLAALFLLELVESWNALPSETPGDGAAGPKAGKAGARVVRGQIAPW